MKKALLLSVFLTLNLFAQATVNVTTLRKPTFRGDIRQFSYTGSVLYLAGYEFGLRSFVAKSTNTGATWDIIASDVFSAADNMNGISFSGDVGIVAGSNGRFFRTTNGGVTWTNKTDSTLYTASFNEVQFVTPSIVYTAGGTPNSSTTHLLKSTNGGETWFALNTGQTNTMYDMHWDNELTGWAAGSSSKIVRTTDGGATWTLSTAPGTTTLYAIRRASASVFYACGTSGTLLKSSDNGVTFTSLTSPTTSPLYTIETFSETEAVVLGSNGIAYSTTDGGTTWALIPPFTSEVIRTSIKIGNKILAGAYKSNISESNDRGLTWNMLTNTYRDLYGIYQDGNRIVTVGDRGDIHISNDNGITWSKKSFLNGSLLYDVYINGNNIYVSGQSGNYYISTDGGQTWANESFGSGTTRNYKLNFFNANEGYMVNNDGNVLYTTDKGVNWLTYGTFAATTLYDIRMLNTTTGFAVGSGERIFKTTNGTTWSHASLAQPTEQLTGVNLVDGLNGFVCGENGTVFRTTDGFATLSMIADTSGAFGKTMYDIVYLAPSEVWASRKDGALLKMNTQGIFVPSWNSLYGESLNAMFKVSQDEFLVCGASGTVYRVKYQPVPVELESFTYKMADGKPVFEWITQTEKNNSGFRIEKKSDRMWIEAGFVRGAGTIAERQNYSFTDNNYSGEKTTYRLAQIDFDGTTKYSDEIEVELVPTEYSLDQNYPNPFNPVTQIKYQLPMTGKVTLIVYDILGKEVSTLVNETKPAGSYSVNFNAASLPSGVYLYELRAGTYTSVKKMTLVK